MIIREYSEADKNQILLLHDEFEREFFPEFHSKDPVPEERNLEERYSYYIDQSGKFWVMEYQKSIVGLIGVQFQSDNRADLIQLQVRKRLMWCCIFSFLFK